MATRCFEYEAVANHNSSLGCDSIKCLQYEWRNPLEHSCEFKLNSTSLGAPPNEGPELTW